MPTRQSLRIDMWVTTCTHAYLGWFNALVHALLGEEIHSMHALGSRHDLLTPHEDIV
jgi:hypothetical protein